MNFEGYACYPTSESCNSCSAVDSIGICGAGTFYDPGQSTNCQPCAVGTYADTFGQRFECPACPTIATAEVPDLPQTTTGKGSASISNCGPSTQSGQRGEWPPLFAILSCCYDIRIYTNFVTL